MQSNELRIGNLLIYGSTILRIYKIGSHGYKCEGFENSKSQNNTENIAQPIRLDDYWLSRLGFKYVVDWEKDNFVLDSEDRFHIRDHSGYGIIIARDIKYVHQLQNLYFFLTGKELNYE